MSRDTKAPLRPDDLPMLEELGDPDWGVEFDAFLKDLFARPYQGLMRAHDQSVLAYRNEDLRELAKREELVNLSAEHVAGEMTACAGAGPKGFEYLMENHVFTLQPPVHIPTRRVFASHLAKGRVEIYRSIAREMAALAIEDVSNRSRIDFQSDVASHVMAHFWAAILGLTEDEGDRTSSLAAEILPALMLRRSNDEAIAANRAAFEYMRTISTAINRTVADGKNQTLGEMASALAEIQIEGRPPTVGEAFGAMLFDGFHTAAVLITNVVYALTRVPGLFARLAECPELVPAAVAEGTRMHAPVTSTIRYAIDDFEHAGVVIPKGTPVTMMWMFGNRDPETFPAPSEFQLDRPLRPQVTFGGGFHICPGRNIVGLVAQEVVGQIVSETVDLELLEEPRWVPGSTLHQVESLPVSVRKMNAGG